MKEIFLVNYSPPPVPNSPFLLPSPSPPFKDFLAGTRRIARMTLRKRREQTTGLWRNRWEDRWRWVAYLRSLHFFLFTCWFVYPLLLLHRFFFVDFDFKNLIIFFPFFSFHRLKMKGEDEGRRISYLQGCKTIQL